MNPAHQMISWQKVLSTFTALPFLQKHNLVGPEHSWESKQPTVCYEMGKGGKEAIGRGVCTYVHEHKGIAVGMSSIIHRIALPYSLCQGSSTLTVLR